MNDCCLTCTNKCKDNPTFLDCDCKSCRWENVKYQAKLQLNIELKDTYSLYDFIENENSVKETHDYELIKRLKSEYPKLSKGIRDENELARWSEEVNSTFYNLI